MKKLLTIYFGVILIVTLIAIGPIPTRAQSSATSGAIVGVVKDQNNAVVPNAKVTLLNASLGIQRTATTSGDGSYVFPIVQPGSGYEIDVEHAGFEKAVVNNLTVRVTEVITANVSLTLGEVSQQVVVSGAATPVETTNATLGSTLTSNVITAIPLPTRDVLDLLATDAGVASTLTSPAATILQGAEAMFVGGNRATSNNYMVNGVDANNFEFHTLGNGIIPVPNPDSVQEFRTETSLYDATTGFSGGGNIALVTRSGTSKYHATVYEFLRNTDMNANDFFFNADGTPRPVMIQNQFGGSVGGPVPKLSKTFWFFNYEGQRQRNGIAGGISGLMPILPAQRTAASMAALYNLPASAIDPVAINVLNAPGPYNGMLFPSGHPTGQPGFNLPGELGSFSFSAPVQINSNQYNGRIDHEFRTGGVVNQLGVTYFANPDSFTNTGGANGTLGQPYDYILLNNTLSVHDVQTIKPDLLNEITVGFTLNNRDIGAINPVSISQLGITRFNSSVITRGPNFDFSDQLGCCGASASSERSPSLHRAVQSDDAV
ncbi:MAG: carboxypeptidase-like regulatory domain-containing protein [Candidatus Acidiferrales bacterium]